VDSLGSVNSVDLVDLGASMDSVASDGPCIGVN
jgi:hypothetical protein